MNLEINDIVDVGQLSRALELSNELSRELHLDRLSRKIIQIIRNNTKTDRVILIIEASGYVLLQTQGEDGEPIEKIIGRLEEAEFFLPTTVFKEAASKPGLLMLGKPQIKNRYQSKDAYFHDFLPNSLSVLTLRNPQEKVIGYLYSESHTPDNDLFAGGAEFLEIISDHLTSSISNAILFDQIKRTAGNPMEIPVSVPSEPVNGEVADGVSKDEVTRLVSREKERIYDNVKLLGTIGQGITGVLSVENIIEQVYENVNNLMDATVFDIGIYNSKNNRIEFPGSIEKGKKLPFNFYEVADESRLAVVCFKEKKEIFINDMPVEFNNYIPGQEIPNPVTGESVASLIYLPILTQSTAIGVITVQSFQTNTYTEYHLDMLRNLAIYVAIALENAFLYEKQRLSSAEHEAEILKHEEEIEKQNKVLAEQKDEIEQAYQNVKLLGEIGQDITANLSVERIIETVYESINTLIDAPMFSIGIYNEKENKIDVPGTIEKDQKLPHHSYTLEDDTRLAVYCFKNLREVFINDFQKEYHDFLPDAPTPTTEHGDLPDSVIYLPLIGKNGPVGVITVQAFTKDAYSEYDMNILRNLAIYAGIALDNALLYESLEEKVKERTQEVVKQKEEIERSYNNIKLLYDIGVEITSSLSTDKIIRKVYESVNSLMDASAFGIGIYDSMRQRIEFRGCVENGEDLPPFYHSMSDPLRFSVWCIKNKQEVVIGNYAEEFASYIPDMKPAEEGGDPDSIIYLPLMVKEKAIGVITIQTFSKNAYNQFHLNILRNLAVYTAIAIENSEQYNRIEIQKEEITKTSTKVTSSIKYAKRIQNAILPKRTLIKDILPESFVFFKPRDIVSGDFFWFLEKEGKIFVAAVDCTGHGVPGAFMSMIGNDLLNEVVNLRGLHSPDDILTQLHLSVKRLLRQDESDNRDGMDMAVCVIDHANKVMEYAGAKNPLIYIKDGELQHIKGDKMPIGGVQKEEQRIFKKHTIDISTPATYYIFTDGYPDQFGGEEGRKFLMKNFRDMLMDIHSLPMDNQRRKLLNTLRDWMAEEPMQTDDILVIGFRI